MGRALTDAQAGVLSRLVEADGPVALEGLVARTEAEATQLRLRRRPGDARAAANALVRRDLARQRGKDRWEALRAGRELVAGGG